MQISPDTVNHQLKKRPTGWRKTLALLNRQKYYYLMLLPGIVFVAIFCYIPMYGVTLAFKDFNPLKGIIGSPWAGFKYFEQLFGSRDFFTVLKNTLVINLMTLVIGFPMPIIFSLMLNEVKSNKFKRSFQTITYLPYFISWVVIAGFVVDLLSPTHGPLAMLSKLMGKEPVFYLIEPQYFRWILVLSNIWKNLGFSTILYLAALANIDPQLYEAATIDGAGKWKQAIHITLSGISSTIVICLILEIGSMMASNFEQIYVLYSPSVYSVGDVIGTYSYRIGLGGAKFSLSTALGLFNSAVSFILLAGTNKLAKKLGSTTMW